MEKEPPTAVILGIVNEGGKKKKEIIDYLNKHGYQTKEVMGTYDFVSYLTDHGKKLGENMRKLRKYFGRDVTSTTVMIAELL